MGISAVFPKQDLHCTTTQSTLFATHSFKMQFKNLLVAFGLVAAATASPVPEPELEARAVSAPFKIRRFTPLAGFDEKNPVVGTWSNNQYTAVKSANQILSYDVTAADAFSWTYDPAINRLRGAKTGTGGLAPRNLQSYSVVLVTRSRSPSAQLLSTKSSSRPSVMATQLLAGLALDKLAATSSLARLQTSLSPSASVLRVILHRQ